MSSFTVQDVLHLDFEMRVGPTSETIQVESGAPLVNGESATVSTLVDNRFVENLPLNGRSFGSLLELDARRCADSYCRAFL